MGTLQWLLVIAWSFVAPGAGQAVAGRGRAAFAWAGVGLVTMLVLPLTIWALFATLAVRAGSIVDAIVRVRRARVKRVEWNRPAVVATGAWVIGMLYARLLVEGYKIPASSMYPTLEIGDHIYVERLTLQWRPPERGEIIVFQQPCMPDRDYIKRVIAVANDTIEVRCNVVYVNGAAVPSELVQGAGCEYKDRDEVQGEWYPRRCSRYRETLDGRSYGVFHDPERPARDEQLRKEGGLEMSDSKDFPELGALQLRNCSNMAPYEGRPAENQLPGKLVELRRPGAGKGACEQQLHFVVPEDSLFVMGDHRSNSNDSRYWGVVPMGNVRGRAMFRWYPLSRFGGL